MPWERDNPRTRTIKVMDGLNDNIKVVKHRDRDIQNIAILQNVEQKDKMWKIWEKNVKGDTFSKFNIHLISSKITKLKHQCGKKYIYI